MSRWMCLHGFTGAPEDWQPVLAAAGEPLKAHCPALLGHGRDEDPTAVDPSTRSTTTDSNVAGSTEGAPFEAEVDRLASGLADRLVLPVGLAGYSMGGRLAVGLLARYPRYFSHAVLLGAHAGLADVADRQNRRDADERLATRLETKGLPAFVDFWQALPLFASQQQLPAQTLERQRRRRLGHRAAGLAKALRALTPGRMPDYRDALTQVMVPVTWVVGELDTKYRDLAADLVARLPRGRLVVLPGVGHNPVLEAPKRVAEILAQASAEAATPELGRQQPLAPPASPRPSEMA